MKSNQSNDGTNFRGVPTIYCFKIPECFQNNPLSSKFPGVFDLTWLNKFEFDLVNVEERGVDASTTETSFFFLLAFYLVSLDSAVSYRVMASGRQFQLGFLMVPIIRRASVDDKRGRQECAPSLAAWTPRSDGGVTKLHPGTQQRDTFDSI